MKFVAKDDIEAPIDFVFEEVSDFDGFQRSAIRRGAKVSREDSLTAPGPGMCWDAAFDLRGRHRQVKITLVEFDRPNGMVLEAVSGGLESECRIELIALSPQRTRLKLHLELKPQTLSAGLLVQSLKLAKGNLTKRMNLKVADYARGVSERARKRA